MCSRARDQMTKQDCDSLEIEDDFQDAEDRVRVSVTYSYYPDQNYRWSLDR